MGTQIRHTRSVCPACLKNIPAALVRNDDGRIFLEKECSEHGAFRSLVWEGCVDFEKWTVPAEPLDEKAGLSCPGSCGICPEHEADTCCVLLEVTGRCNLNCKFCFAHGGETEDEPDLEELKDAVDEIVRRCGKPLLQLSGGEPTLRDDLPELVSHAKEAGCSYVQLNTNGIRLAEDPEYAERLAEAGLDIVFLQFDGTNDEIYEALRGQPLLRTKLDAIEICSGLKIGVTLVPTVVKGINDSDLGRIISLAASLAPGVRGIHFQPVSYFGRYPKNPADEDRYTLDRLMMDISSQSGIPLSSFLPSRCDHPLCGFHSSFLIGDDGSLKPLSDITRSPQGRCSAADNREYVARRWIRAEGEIMPAKSLSGEMDFDTFLYRLRNRSITLTAMAFQDAMNLNIERLHRCSLHVYTKGKIKPFCSNYLSPLS